MSIPRRDLRWFFGIIVASVCVCQVQAAREGPLKQDPSDELFSGTAVRHLRIDISQEDMATLRKPLPQGRSAERPAVPATVREGDQVWTNVAVHLKGSWGSFRPVDDKPALTLSFDKFAEGQRFHGLQKISLNNSVQDPSYTSEKVCREIFVAAGVPVPRADYATVELNRRQLGLFVLVEGWNKQFLRRQFSNVKGNFYDFSNVNDIREPFQAAFGNEPTNHAAMRALAKAAVEPDHVKRLARLRQTVDVDRMLSLHTLDVMMWNWDGYGLNHNNFRAFHDLASDRIVFFPHGLDQMFWKPNGPIVTGRAGIVVKSLLETVEGRRLYLARFAELRTNVFDARAITNEIATLTTRLRPALAKGGMGAASSQREAANELIHLIVARTQDVDAQLASVKSFVPLPLDATMSLTNWTKRRESGAITFNETTTAPFTLRVQANNVPSLGVWTTTVWLEEGRYRIEGRVKTLGVRTDGRADSGAGFRVWSSRKETRGASWSWFPYGSARDPRLGGLISGFTNAPQQRLSGDSDWTNVTHEFELRQPMADLEIQCALQASAGAAWFDLSSLKIRRVSLNISKSGVRGD